MKESRYNIWVDDGPRWYVYNGVSGRVVAVPAGRREPIDRYLAGDHDAPADPDLLYALARGQMILPDDLDELDLLRERYAATRRNPHRFHLTVVTSLGCNFGCPYCFEAKHPSLLADDVRQRLLDLVDRRLPGIRELAVLWYGGEPLVGLPALLSLSDELLSRAAGAGVAYRAAIITNGYLLTAPVARRLRDRAVTVAQVGLDGPPEVHDVRRPLAGGRGTFREILANVVAVAGILDVTVRVNLDTGNLASVPRLLRMLADAGLAGRVAVSPGHVLPARVNLLAPSAGYATECLSRPAFAEAEQRFLALAGELGFATPPPPAPTGAPCTAVRDNELVIGSRGEIYKCTETVGDPNEVIGDLRDWPAPGDRLSKWLTYDPFTDPECRACPALPVCMGGCAHHAMNSSLADSRCSTFRFRHRDQVRRLIAARTRR
ncbi:radical SAM protein [Actinoplanes sichuanensis]|uniref:Radical SAM/SPASM domain-containing protein n=1 Tax=Actinoplanes sichuanensis TaxID=512349 RepID=A0ABW4A0X1_9ACTN|nr:radical SAM protein [Actinoplanes sichuanensis]BEL04124.1 radical SAM protein [Actinoplanes sichuanensis]